MIFLFISSGMTAMAYSVAVFMFGRECTINERILYRFIHIVPLTTLEILISEALDDSAMVGMTESCKFWC